MDEFMRGIFEQAILSEQAASRLYLDLSRKAVFKEAKLVLEELAKEEMVHESLFRKLNLSVISMVNRSELSSIPIFRGFEPDSLPKHEKIQIAEILDLAISEEKKAYDYYSVVGRHLNSNDAIETLKEIARQEDKHRLQLIELKRRIRV